MILMLVAFMPEGHAAAVALCARLMSTAGDGAAVAIGFGMAKVLGLERAANVEGKNDTNGG